jgi:hypothetical protein
VRNQLFPAKQRISAKQKINPAGVCGVRGSARGAPLIFSVLPSRAVGKLACRPRNEGASEPRENGWFGQAGVKRDERRSLSGDRRTFSDAIARKRASHTSSASDGAGITAGAHSLRAPRGPVPHTHTPRTDKKSVSQCDRRVE